MAYPVENIIDVVTRISSAGLGTANFGVGMIFAENDEITDNTFQAGTFRDFGGLAEVTTVAPIASETYYAAQAWFGVTPKPKSLRVYRMAPDQTELAAAAAAINNGVWWYWTCFNRPFYSVDEDVLAMAAFLDANGKFFVNCQDATDIRDVSSTTDIASKLTAQGTRRSFTLSRSTGETFGFYGAFAAAAILSRVNFSVTNSTITLEGKILGIAGEDLQTTAYTAMKAKKAAFFTKVELQGQSDSGRMINSISHSAYNEEIADVFNLDGMVNEIRVAMYNAIQGATSKVRQTPGGQQIVHTAATTVCERFIDNGFLGERNYIDPETGEQKTSRGYVLLSKPSDILDLSDSDRANHFAAPVRLMVFRAGSIWAANVQVDVY